VREKLNGNPAAQVGLILILVAVAAYMLLGKSGGEEEAAESSPAGATVATESAVAGAEEGTVVGVDAGSMPDSVPAPPPPAVYREAYKANRTVALVIVHNGGIDDRRTAAAGEALAQMPGVTLIKVPVHRLPSYAAITVGLEVSRVPALIVVRPRHLSGGVPQATVDYGFQTAKSAEQAVRDASYKGPERAYHPE
jgi:hypothetical protein